MDLSPKFEGRHLRSSFLAARCVFLGRFRCEAWLVVQQALVHGEVAVRPL